MTADDIRSNEGTFNDLTIVSLLRGLRNMDNVGFNIFATRASLHTSTHNDSRENWMTTLIEHLLTSISKNNFSKPYHVLLCEQQVLYWMERYAVMTIMT